MTSRLIDALVTTDALADAFSDRALLQAMFDFEAALARAEADAGVIPVAAADVIARAAVVDDTINMSALVDGARAEATASISVVNALTTRVQAIDAESGRYVHWGATSQDVFDTALVLCVRRAWSSIESDHTRLTLVLNRLADDHAGTVMLGRTLLQPAIPTTFGLKAAGWLGAASRTWRQWSDTYRRLGVIQFGGAAGTLAALGHQGPAVESALAAGLGLSVPDAPWHAHRDRVAAFVAAAAVHVATLGKIARDVSLLMQHEVREAAEPGGGSSTMPHKRNPSGSAVVLAAANRLPGLVASVLAAMIHEHERGVGGWHAEGAIVADATQTAGSAVEAMARVIEGLSVNPERMRDNLDSTGGVIFAEQLSLMLAPTVGRARAAELTKAVVAEAMSSVRTLKDVAATTPDVIAHLTAGDLERLGEPSGYLGSADVFRQRLLAAASSSRETRQV